MKKTSDIITPDQIIDIIVRRRWFLMIPMCLALIAGIFLVTWLPKIYSASTLILIQPQKVPDDYVRSIVSSDIDSRINTISQQILSRSNLEKIIDEFNIFAESGHKKMFMEDKIEVLRSRISVDLIREDRRRPADAFSISFKGKNPRLVMRITNTLASYFIDENLKVREAQALGTSDFLEDELNDIRIKLEKQEEALKNYRARYMGGLPEQLQTNLRILEGMQLQLNMRNESLRYAKNNLILIEKQLSEESRAVSDSVEASIPVETVFKSEDQIKLEQLKSSLAELELSYTDRHPDIIRLKKQVQDLEAKIAETRVEQPAEVTPVVRQRPRLRPVPNGSVQRLAERDELKIQIASLESEIAKINDQIKHYQIMVENTPKREQELLSLNRDYENIKESYNSLLSRKLESDIAVNMEKKQKGEQFRILDAAKLPEKPSEPDMKKLFILVIGAGIGLGAGLIFLLEYLDTSFRKPEEMESAMDLPILCTIPHLYHPRDIRYQRINQALSILTMMVAMVLLAGFTALTFKGVDKTLEFVKGFINI